MKSAAKKSNRAIWFPLSLIFLILLSGALRWAWIERWSRLTETEARNIGEEIGTNLTKEMPPNESRYQKLLFSNPDLAYVVVADFRSGYRSGAINAASLQKGASNIEYFRTTHGDSSTLAHLIRPGRGFPGEYVDVFSVSVEPSHDSTDRTPIGMIKVAYIVPGFPFGRGFVDLWAIVSSAFALVAFGWSLAILLRQPRRRDSYRKSEKDVSSKHAKAIHSMEDLEWLDEPTERIERREVDDTGELWRILFNGSNLDGLTPVGAWYVNEGDLIGHPWAGSVVTSRSIRDRSYVFWLSFRKMAGPDGCAVLFSCGAHHLVWIVAGWGNTRSEVIGYPSTQKEHSIARQRWYDLEIRVDEDRVCGFISGRKAWELERTKIQHSSPETGFQHGVGVGVWNTLARFRNLRFRTLDHDTDPSGIQSGV